MTDLKVGDKVRIVNRGSGFYGKTATVVRVYDEPGYFAATLDVDPKVHGTDGVPFGDHEMEKIDVGRAD